MAEDLEDKVKSMENEQVRKKSSLGSYILNLGLAGGATALSYAAVGFGGPLTGIGFGLGSAILNLFKKSEDEKSKGPLGVIRSYTVGTLMGMIGVPTGKIF